MSNAVLALLKKKTTMLNIDGFLFRNPSMLTRDKPRKMRIVAFKYCHSRFFNKHQQKLTAKTKTSKLDWSCTDLPDNLCPAF